MIPRTSRLVGGENPSSLDAHSLIAWITDAMSPDDVVASQWTTGVAFSVAASVIGAASKLCIRKSYTVLECPEYESSSLLPPDSLSSRRIPCLRYLHAYLLRGIGVLGMTTLNPLCCVMSLLFASPSILAPFSGLTLVFIVACSHKTIGEKPSTLQVIAAGLIVAGQIVVALFGDHTNIGPLSIDNVREAYLEPEFVSFTIAFLGWMALLVGLIHSSSASEQRFAWGVIGGSVAGVQPFIKDALAVISGLQQDNVPLEQYPSGLFVLLLLAGVLPLIGLVLLMQCMRRYDASYSGSMFVGSMIVSVSVVSAVRYHTFDHLNGFSDAVLYVLGLCILTSGCVVLACEGDVTLSETYPNDMKKEDSLRRSSSDVTYGTIQLSEDQGTDSADSSISSELNV